MKKLLFLLAIAVMLICVLTACQPPVEEHVHSFGEWEVTVEPTCVDSGLMTRSCECGEYEEEIINPIPEHTAGAWEVTVQPGCTSTGSKVQSCVHCGEILDTQNISATGHIYGEWVLSNKDAKCEENLIYISTCSGCGDSKQDIRKPAGHSWDEGVVDPDLNPCEFGLKFTCSLCGENKYSEGTGHEWGEWSYANIGLNSCEFKNSQIRYCEICNQYDVKSEAGPGHVWGEWYQTNIDACAADCTVVPEFERQCFACGKFANKVGSASAHNWSQWEQIIPEVTPDCTEDVLFTRTCSTCGIVANEYRPGPGHVWGEWYQTNSDACADDCTVAPAFERVCSVCGNVDHKIEKAPGHKFGEWNDDDLDGMNPCEFINGQKRFCAVCNQYEIRFDRGDGHEWSEWEFIESGLNPCEAINVRLHSCAICGKEEIDFDEGPGHNWSEWEVLPNETGLSDCIVDTQLVRVCADCGKVDEDAIPATGHEWGEWVPAYTGEIPQNCELDVVYIRYCANCEDVDNMSEAGPGHVWGEWVIGALDADTKGIARLTCQVCAHEISESLPELDPENYHEYIKGDCHNTYDTYIFYIERTDIPEELLTITVVVPVNYVHQDPPAKEDCEFKIVTDNGIYYLYTCKDCGKHVLAYFEPKQVTEE